jgi:hypothetical protein
MHSAVAPLPAGVVAVPEPIRGTAFFPGGLGLWMEGEGAPEFPAGHIMVVGQDFNSSAVYERVSKLGTEVDTSATWRGLRGLLASSDVSVARPKLILVLGLAPMKILARTVLKVPTPKTLSTIQEIYRSTGGIMGRFRPDAAMGVSRRTTPLNCFWSFILIRCELLPVLVYLLRWPSA